MSQVLTVAQTAKILDVGVNRVLDLLKRKQLKGQHPSPRVIIFMREDVEAFKNKYGSGHSLRLRREGGFRPNANVIGHLRMEIAKLRNRVTYLENSLGVTPHVKPESSLCAEDDEDFTEFDSKYEKELEDA